MSVGIVLHKGARRWLEPLLALTTLTHLELIELLCYPQWENKHCKPYAARVLNVRYSDATRFIVRCGRYLTALGVPTVKSMTINVFFKFINENQ